MLIPAMDQSGEIYNPYGKTLATWLKTKALIQASRGTIICLRIEGNAIDTAPAIIIAGVGQQKRTNPTTLNRGINRHSGKVRARLNLRTELVAHNHAI